MSQNLPPTGNRYSSERKNAGLRLVIEAGQPVADVSWQLGISKTTLQNWINKWETNPQTAYTLLTVEKRTQWESDQEELSQLRQENKILKKELALLRNQINH